MTFTAHAVGAIRKADIAAALTAPEYTDAEVSDLEAEMFAAAVSAVETLAQLVGQPDHRITIGISGHANPGHAYAEGDRSDEMISISVSVVRPPG